MPHYPRLIQLLQIQPHRLTAAGEIDLTPTEAHIFRLSDFPTARTGLWKIPPLPVWLTRAAGLPTQLSDGWTWTPPPRPAPPPAVPLDQPLEFSHTRLLDQGLDQRVRHWLDTATPPQCRVLLALLRYPDGISKRRLQQNLHRLRAHELNSALRALVSLGLVVPNTVPLVLSTVVPDALNRAHFGVSRPPRVRAWRAHGLERRPPRRSLPLALAYYTRPEVGTTAWGHWMAAKHGGLARQRQCRARGINPWAGANARRRQLRRLRQQRVGPR